MTEIAPQGDAARLFDDAPPAELTAFTDDDQLAAMAAGAERIAVDRGGRTVLVEAGEYLAAVREQLRHAVRAELRAATRKHQRAKEVERTRREDRDRLIRLVDGFGDSDREIAALAQLSHVAVGRVLAKPSAPS